jgi:hypothetical protein
MTPKELKESKQLLEDIKSLQDDITKNTARYNREGKLGVKAQRELNNLKATEAALNIKIADGEAKSEATQKKTIKNAKDRQNLAKSANRLAKSSKAILLSRLGINAKDLSLVKAAAAAKQKGNEDEVAGYNALERLRQDTIAQLEEGTFVTEEFDSKVKELEESFGDILDSGDFSDFKGSFESARKDSKKIMDSLQANIPFLDKMDDLKQKASDFASIFTSGPTMALAAAGLLVKVITDFVMQAKEARQELGITAGSALTLSADMQTASKAGKMFGGDSEKASASVRALAESMGRVPKLSQASAFQFGRIASLSGASAESLATIVELQALSQGISQDKAIDDLASLEALSESEGVLKSQVFDDVANAAKDQALFFGKSAIEIGKAAVQMRKLGIEASALNNLAESLLDLESSIGSEFELQALFGKNINLNKARQLAFDRDSVGLAEEIKMQLGGQFDLSTANAAQVKSLTSAFGLTQEQLQKVIQGQDIFNNKTDEAKDGAMSLTTKFAILGALLVGIAGAVVGALTLGTGVKKSLTGALKGGIGGAAVGAGLGMVAANSVGKMEDASIERKSVGSMEPAATFSLGDAASINVSKETQDSINLEMGKLVSVIREELVAEVKSANKDNKETLGRVISATEDNTRAVRKIM